MICGIAPLLATSIYSVEGVAGLFGRVFFGVLADRIGVRRIIVVGLAMQAVGIYLYIYVNELTGFYALAVILGIVYGGVMPLYSVLARDYFGQKVLGTVLGGATMISSFGMAFGPVGGGWLSDNFGSYYWLYVASAAVGLAAAGMALAFPPPNAEKDEPPAKMQPA
jgi:MFS family permease